MQQRDLFLFKPRPEPRKPSRCNVKHAKSSALEKSPKDVRFRCRKTAMRQKGLPVQMSDLIMLRGEPDAVKDRAMALHHSLRLACCSRSVENRGCVIGFGDRR